MQFQNNKERIIIDFGSQVTKLIARQIKIIVYSEIITPKKFLK